MCMISKFPSLSITSNFGNALVIMFQCCFLNMISQFVSIWIKKSDIQLQKLAYSWTLFYFSSRISMTSTDTTNPNAALWCCITQWAISPIQCYHHTGNIVWRCLVCIYFIDCNSEIHDLYLLHRTEYKILPIALSFSGLSSINLDHYRTQTVEFCTTPIIIQLVLMEYVPYIGNNCWQIFKAILIPWFVTDRREHKYTNSITVIPILVLYWILLLLQHHFFIFPTIDSYRTNLCCDFSVKNNLFSLHYNSYDWYPLK